MKKISQYIILIIMIYVGIELLSYCSLFILKKCVYLDYYPTDVLTDKNVNDINELIESNTNNYKIYSATLGWSIKSNGFTKLYQANSAGLRGNRNYSKIPEDGVFRISSYGDSFTHCSDVLNNETWQTYIEESGVSRILCKRSFSIIVNHPVFEQNSKMIQSIFPVSNWHSPLFTGIIQG